jgi:hypothetical protein
LVFLGETVEYIVIAIVALIIWGNLSRKGAAHPLNRLTVKSKQRYPLCSVQSTVGDNFNSGCAIALGVPETCKPVTISVAPALPAHVTLPVDPPPIAIQQPPIIAPKPPLRIVPATTTYGGGPSVGGKFCYCTLDQLASNPSCRNLGSGCGTF